MTQQAALSKIDKAAETNISATCAAIAVDPAKSIAVPALPP